MTVTVRHADPGDVDAMADLLAEMDGFYGDEPEDPQEVRRKQIADALFTPVPWAHALVAMDDHQLVGLATYSYHWPAVGLTRSIFLKELYVAKRAWRRGVGRALMQRLLALASETDCSRVEWMTDAPNKGAQEFYGTLGFKSDGSKLVYRVQ